MKSFEIPAFYKSPLIAAIKQQRKLADKMKKDFTPTKLDFGVLNIYLARHFGFCYGVENAIEIAFKTVNENPGRRIFLLSEMIHNPRVNADLVANGVQFIMDTLGNHFIEWDDLKADDIVIIPAFGTTLETEAKLRSKGIDPLTYNTTCPFVEKVWNRSEQIGQKGYTIIIHGKPNHEETRATFSHSSHTSPSVVVKDLNEAKKLEKYITRSTSDMQAFYTEFKGQYSKNFDVEKDLNQIGVVNQTTMLASDTQEIADYLKQVIVTHYAGQNDRFADTKDTLCYATNDNQSAVIGMLETNANLAIVVGGYNSSNTSHLVELCEQKLPTYYIEDKSKIDLNNSITHFDLHTQQEKNTINFIPQKENMSILITSGASCPDAIVENVIYQLVAMFPDAKSMDEVISSFKI